MGPRQEGCSPAWRFCPTAAGVAGAAVWAGEVGSVSVAGCSGATSGSSPAFSANGESGSPLGSRLLAFRIAGVQVARVRLAGGRVDEVAIGGTTGLPRAACALARAGSCCGCTHVGLSFVGGIDRRIRGHLAALDRVGTWRDDGGHDRGRRGAPRVGVPGGRSIAEGDERSADGRGADAQSAERLCTGSSSSVATSPATGQET